MTTGTEVKTADAADAVPRSETTSRFAGLRRFAERLRRWAASVEAPSRAVLAFSALLTVATWHMPAFEPTQPRGDHDYGLAIALANQYGLSFGDRIATTYGPLYYLAIPSVINRAEVFIGFLFWFVFMVGCLAACYQALRRHLPVWGAWTVCTVIAISFSITPLTSVITATFGFAVLLAIFYVRDELPRWADRAFPIAMGLLAAAMLLTKFSVGMMIGPVALGAVLARKHRVLRSFIEYAVAGVAGLVLMWILAGQPPLQVGGYVIRQLSVGSGHAESMGWERADRMWEYPILAALLIITVVAIVTAKVPGRRWLLWIGVALGGFLMFKQGFVRHDSHSAQFFAPLFALLCVLAVVKRSAVLAATAVVTVVTQAASYGGGLYTIDPSRSVQLLANGLTVVVSGSHQDEVLDEARQQLRGELEVPQRFLDTIGGRPVRAESFDYNLAWSNGLPSAIPPTLLNYGAYTRALDELNQKWIAGASDAPEFIVREDSRLTLDSRHPLWDPPRTQLEQACRYELVDTSPKWKLLRRIENRCGQEIFLSTTTFSAGQQLDVPQVRQGQILIAKVHLEPSIKQQIKTLLFRSGALWLTIDGEVHRLPVSHQDAPLMIAAPGDESLVLGGKELAANRLSMNMPGQITFSVVNTK